MSRVKRQSIVKQADAADAIIGNNVRIQRMARSWSQSELAGRLGVSFQQLQKYELGTNRIGSGRLWRIAAALEIPLMVLFEGVETTRKNRRAEPESRFFADPQCFR